MPILENVIITSEPAKLPESYAALLDVQKPLPPGVMFFEKRIVFADLLKTAVLSVGLGVVGVLSLILGVATFPRASVHPATQLDYLPFYFGLTCVIACWVIAMTLGQRHRLMRSQRQGEQTRLGIFLTPDAIFEANEYGYCLIPRAHFRGVAGATVRYVLNDQEKSFSLPQSFVVGDLAGLIAAIHRWNFESNAGGAMK